jgi:hypothetical protein
MKIRAMFTGSNGSMGFQNGRIYEFDMVSHVLICDELDIACPYDSVQAFLLNWTQIQVLEQRNIRRQPKLFDG